jgi:hypothetical protein
MSSIDPLATLVTSAAAFPLVALIASIAALILSVFVVSRALTASLGSHANATRQP